MKYRKLTLEELQSLEKEFVDFLIVNGITADDWVKIKKEEPEKSENIVEIFSDFILESVLKKISFLVYKGRKELYTYQCLQDKIVMVGLKAPEDSDADFTDPEFINRSIRQSQEGLKIFTTDKKYSPSREQELFEMLQKGCEISDGRYFKVLCLAL